jgi:hypothetical protein
MANPLDEQMNKKQEQEDELKTQRVYPHDDITEKRDVLTPHKDGQGADLEEKEKSLSNEKE